MHYVSLFFVLVKTVLKSLLSTFSHIQNAPVNLQRRHQMNFKRESETCYILASFLVRLFQNLK